MSICHTPALQKFLRLQKCQNAYGTQEKVFPMYNTQYLRCLQPKKLHAVQKSFKKIVM